MRYYQPNPACGCGRCSTRGLMGPAVLVTLGLLFLLANMSDYPFERTWPILLIVIGAIKVVRYMIPDSGHFNPGQYPPPPYPPPYQAGVYAAAGQNAAPPSGGPAGATGAAAAGAAATGAAATGAAAAGEGGADVHEVHNG